LSVEEPEGFSVLGELTPDEPGASEASSAPGPVPGLAGEPAGEEQETGEAAPGGPEETDVAEVEEFTKGDFVVCITRKTRFRRLHIVGGCPLLPGLDYQDFVVCGRELPARDTYAAHCRNCWRRAGGPQAAAGKDAPPAEDAEGMCASSSSEG
jgi:hypothetical protein